MRALPARAIACASLLLVACAPQGRNRSDGGAPPEEDSAAVVDGAAPDAPAVIDAATDAPAAMDSATDAPAVIDAATDASETATPVTDSAPDAPPPEAMVERCPVAGFTRCGAQCVDITASAEHCGACNQRCVAGAHSSAECVAGDCDRACERGYGDCDMDPSNGCEALLASPMNCGACGRACASGELCTAGACARFETAPPPVPRAPISGARVMRRRPSLRWAYAPGLPTTAEVQLCRTRLCTDPTAITAMVSGDHYEPLLDLAPGVYFWRVRARDGARTGTAYSPTWQFRVMPGPERGEVPAGFDADFNGDGLADIAVGAAATNGLGAAYVYYGAAGMPHTTPDWSGRGADSSGPTNCYGTGMSYSDLNGDGFVDLAVSDACAGYSMGRTYIYLGSATGLPAAASLVYPGSDARSGFGGFMSAVGDLNNDGYGDLLAGAPFSSELGIPRTGAAFVLHGRAMGLPTVGWSVRETAMTNVTLGRDVAYAGDVNNDGWADILVAASGQDVTPRAYVLGFLGGAGGFPMIASTRYDGPMEMGSLFGRAMTPGGDLNGDGFADVLLGASEVSARRGLVWVLQGSRDGLPRAPTLVFNGEGTGEALGAAIAGGDDVNGDGYSDVAMNRRCWPDVLHGSASGLATTPAARLQDPANSMHPFCTMSLAMVGDVDGDGYGDVVLGSYGFESNVGAVFLFRGGAAGVGVRPAWVARGMTAGAEFGDVLAQ